jgi:hypothetical protein
MAVRLDCPEPSSLCKVNWRTEASPQFGLQIMKNNARLYICSHLMRLLNCPQMSS